MKTVKPVLVVVLLWADTQRKKSTEAIHSRLTREMPKQTKKATPRVASFLVCSDVQPLSDATLCEVFFQKGG
jgi:hypothetical protein